MSAAKIVINEFFWHSTIEPEPLYLSGAYWRILARRAVYCKCWCDGLISVQSAVGPEIAQSFDFYHARWKLH